MRRRALVLAVAMAAAAIWVWWPGCGFVDPWVVLSWACDAAGGGSGGAG